MSASTRAALHRVSDPAGVLLLLKIEDDSLSGPVRLVNDTRGITSQGVAYVGLPFEVQLPNDKNRETPRSRLVMDNVGRDITAELERLPPGRALKATLMLVHRSTPDVVDYQFVAPLSNVRVDVSTVTATMGPDEILRRPAVAIRFDPITAPALFAG